MNMSALPNNGPGRCCFSVDPSFADEMGIDPEKVTEYLGQMEPVPIFLMKTLQKRGETLDRLIVLDTRETMEQQVPISSEFEKNRKKEERKPWTHRHFRFFGPCC